jgi:hypothetical protein
MAIYGLTVRDRSDYGQFFVDEREPVERNGDTIYCAIWTVYSSYGVYGHCWSSMGAPFAKFIQDINQDYLLGKIADMVPCGEKACRSVRDRIRQARKDGYITKEIARDALDAVKEIEDLGDDQGAAGALYASVPISKVNIEWCDVEARVWHPQAVGFSTRIWPKFVDAMKERIPAAMEGAT